MGGGTARQLEAVGSKVIERPAARAFLARATSLDALDALDTAFAAAIIEAGFTAYTLFALGQGHGMPPRPHSLEDSHKPGCYRLVVPVEHWAGGWTLVELVGHRGVIDRAARARAAMLATLFAGCREALAG